MWQGNFSHVPLSVLPHFFRYKGNSHTKEDINSSPDGQMGGLTGPLANLLKCLGKSIHGIFFHDLEKFITEAGELN